MNLRKAIFVFGGGGLIILILAYRFGLLAKLKKAAGPVWDKQVKVRLADVGQKKAPPAKSAPAEVKSAPAVKAAPASEKAPVVKAAPASEKAPVVKAAPASEKAPVVKAPSLVKSVPDFVKNEAPAAKAAPEAEAPAKAPARASEKELNPLGLGDPFAYASNGAGNYTPLASGRTVGVIAVKGIICLDGQPPVAILSLKEKDRVYYVKKGDVIRVNTAGKKGAVRSEAYIVVKDVRNDEVELIQQERPDKVIIIR